MARGRDAEAVALCDGVLAEGPNLKAEGEGIASWRWQLDEKNSQLDETLKIRFSKNTRSYDIEGYFFNGVKNLY